jgi:putative spermidine/putrescine transport system substrate-binding protein
MLRNFIITTALVGSMSGTAFANEPLLSMSWEEIVAQAKTEGRVTWYNWYFEPEFREVVKAFEAEYGLAVTIPDVNSGDDVLNKLIAERSLSSTDIDLMSMGGATGFRITPAELFMGPITPVLPEGAALNPVVEGADWGGHAAQFWGNQTCLAYDPSRVNLADLPDTVEELAAWMAANPGQLGFNFENGGSAPSAPDA